MLVELDECELFGAEVGDAVEGEGEVERVEVDESARRGRGREWVARRRRRRFGGLRAVAPLY